MAVWPSIRVHLAVIHAAARVNEEEHKSIVSKVIEIFIINFLKSALYSICIKTWKNILKVPFIVAMRISNLFEYYLSFIF